MVIAREIMRQHLMLLGKEKFEMENNRKVHRWEKLSSQARDKL
jgi:hypothetical protein